jgi:hypothetical protein
MLTLAQIREQVLSRNQYNNDDYDVDVSEAFGTDALIVPRGGPAAGANMSTMLMGHGNVVHNHFYMQVREAGPTLWSVSTSTVLCVLSLVPLHTQHTEPMTMTCRPCCPPF